MYKIIVKNDMNKIWCIESITLASYLFHGLIAIVKDLTNKYIYNLPK